MIRKLFFYLLKKYSKSEKDRLQILSELDKGIYYNYHEQTPFGNVYNFFIEFIMSNEFIKKRVKENDVDSLEITKRGITKAYDEAIGFIKEDTKEIPKIKCDYCGTTNPETFPGGRLTKCCAVTERGKGAYAVKDENGDEFFALGKTWRV